MAVALPTAGSTVEAGTGFIKETMGPAIAPVKAAGAALGNPLQTLNAPPVVMAAAAAMGTMFGADSDDPDKKLKDAGDDLTESSNELDESAEGLAALGSMLGLENLETILEDIRDSVFSLEKKLVGQMRQEKGAVDEETGKKVGGQFMGFREAREKVDPTARLKAIEEKREAARAAKGKGGAPGAKPGEEEEEEAGFLGGILAGLMGGIMSFLSPIIKIIKGLWKFSKAASKLFGKIFLPITIIMGIFSFISGFVDEFKKEGDIVESMKKGLMNVVDNLIDMPLNLIKDMISWIAGFLGFDEFAADLDSFEFDFAGLFGRFFDVAVTWVKDTFNEVWPKIKELFTLEGMLNFFEGYVDTMIDAPLNWIKGLVESVLRFFGMEDAADAVGDFEFDLSGGVREAFTAISDKFTELWTTFKETLSKVWKSIKGIFTWDNITAILKKGAGNTPLGWALGKLSGAFGGDEDSEEEAAAPESLPNAPGLTSTEGALGVQELDEGLMSKVSAIVTESALQAAENTASAQGGGVSVSTSSVSNQNINQSSAQTVVSAAIEPVRGEDAGMQV